MRPSVSKMEEEGKWRVFRCALTVAHTSMNLAGRDIRNILDEALGLAFDRKELLAQEHILNAIQYSRHNLVEVGPHKFIPATPQVVPVRRRYAEIDNPYTS